MSVDPKKLRVLVEGASGRASPAVPLPSPADVLYERAIGKRGKTCSGCVLWAASDQRCLLMGPGVPVHGMMVCGYHAPGEPQLYVATLGGMPSVDPLLAGLIEAPKGGTCCGGCRYYDGDEVGGKCRAVAKDGQPASVEALGCCSRWTARDQQPL